MEAAKQISTRVLKTAIYQMIYNSQYLDNTRYLDLKKKRNRITSCNGLV